MAHRRYNLLTDEWVLCSPGRLKRPWLGERDTTARDSPPPYDPECYMCPGNRRARGDETPEYRGVFAFDNDYPALTAESEPVATRALLVAEPERGRCRVLCFSPRHDLHLGELDRESVRAVVDAWADETERLQREDCADYVQVFENRGAMMGASNPHPHGQIWATGQVPTLPARKARQQDSYRDDRGTDLLGDYIAEELHRGERIVEENEYWVQVVPFWAIWPFETMLVPRRHVGLLGELDGKERDALAALVGRLTRRYDALFETPFPYSMGWYQRPFDGGPHRGSRLHASYFPPLVRSASVRKFLVGYELSAESQRDFTAEEAAERLRAVENVDNVENGG